MRWLPNPAYGTERYPENVARGLRILNIVAWIVAFVCVSFAARRLLDPEPGMAQRAIASVIAAIAFAIVPLLHRLSPLAAPFAMAVLLYGFTSFFIWRGGTDGGAWLNYISASVLVVVVLGAQRLLLTSLLAAAALGMVVVVHVLVPGNTGYQSARAMFYGNFLVNVLFNGVALFATMHYLLREIARSEAVADGEFKRSESLLRNVLPAAIVERLKGHPDTIVADKYADASILFADMANFTAHAGDVPPEALVQFLDRVYTEFDRLTERHGLEKIKTSGDAYMVVSGVPEPRPDHAEALAAFALDMRDAALAMHDLQGNPVALRIGMASGPVVAGIVGKRKLFYDVWGDAVNVAARMETTSEPGRIQVAPPASDRLRAAFALEARGTIEVKGKGAMTTSYLVGRGRPANA